MTNPSLILCSLYLYRYCSVLFVAARVVAQHVGSLVTFVARQRLQRVELRPRTGLARRGLPDFYAQVEPRRLAGHRVGVGDAALAGFFRQQFRNQVVEQEALGRLGSVLLQAPRALLLADSVPGPDG